MKPFKCITSNVNIHALTDELLDQVKFEYDAVDAYNHLLELVHQFEEDGRNNNDRRNTRRSCTHTGGVDDIVNGGRGAGRCLFVIDSISGCLALFMEMETVV